MACATAPRSLEAAIREKYCGDEEGEAGKERQLPASKQIKESALHLKPGANPVQRMVSIVLDRRGVSHVRSGAELADLCPRVRELHLGHNRISQWTDVCSLLVTLPQLNFLDLTHNPLPSSLSPSPSPHSPSLHTLVLNSTNIPWPVLQACLSMLPSLQELHLTQNGYTQVNLDPSFSHAALQRLHINNNSLSEWREVTRLSPAFPNLHTLVAIGNPLEAIPEVQEEFPALYCLTLSSTKLSEWRSIEHLSSLPALCNLSVRCVPLGEGMSEEERRLSTIARMPRLQKLNKSEISETEREDAERWIIRRYLGSDSKPALYQQLVEKHGSLQPLPDIDLSPHSQASIEFHFDYPDHQRVEEHTVDLWQSAAQLKRWVSGLLDLPQRRLRLFYMAAEDSGSYSMACRVRPLHAYGMKDGDQVLVQILS